MLVASAPSHAAEASESANVPAKMTVTSSVASDKRMPEISREDVRIMLGKERLPVAQRILAKGEQARLDLFLLIDDSRLGLRLEDLRTFINNQPSTTAVGVEYMNNAGGPGCAGLHDGSCARRHGTAGALRFGWSFLKSLSFGCRSHEALAGNREPPRGGHSY
jgi:hypothetical protein